MDQIIFTVYGNPLPKQSTRVAVKGGKVHAYADPRILAYQDFVTALAQEAMEGHPPFTGDLALYVCFYRDNKRRVDLDNLCKLVCDAMNGVVQVDDQQFMEKHLFKKYDKKMPRSSIVVKVLP